jgi:GntP family gluconate:H+ symporter
MPLMHAFALAMAACFIAAATRRGRMHPFLAVIVAATGFALACGLSVSQLGKNFGTGFGQTVNTLGLPVLAATMVAVLATTSGADASLARVVRHWRTTAHTSLCAALGVVAGTGAMPAASFAVLAPLRTAIGGGRVTALTLGLAVSAGQACLLPSPVLVAATALLAAQWTRVLTFGIPLALLSAATGAMFAARMPQAGQGKPTPAQPDAGPTQAAGLAASCLLMAALLCVQSLGDIPSEPLGGGGTRELILGAGRPLVVLLAGVAVMATATRGWRNEGLAEQGWVAASIARAAPLMLLLGAVGGMQNFAQTTQMAPMLAERLLPLPLGILLPFLIASLLKILQGASLVAAITAAGMIQPLLPALGLDGENARALCVLAVGAGAMTGAHVNDGFFWMVADAARLRPAAALAQITFGTLIQGFVSLSILAALRAIIG